jgi:hypothetical protein
MAPTAARPALCPRVARRPGDRPPGSRLHCVCRPGSAFRALGTWTGIRSGSRVHVCRCSRSPGGTVACLDGLRAGIRVRMRLRSHVHEPDLSMGGRGVADGRIGADLARPDTKSSPPNHPKAGKNGTCGLPVSPSDASPGKGCRWPHPARPTTPTCTLPEHRNMSPCTDSRGRIHPLCPYRSIFSHPGTGTHCHTASLGLTWRDMLTRFQNGLTG